MNVILVLFALFLLLGMVGDKNGNSRLNYTLAFIAVIVAIIAIN